MSPRYPDDQAANPAGRPRTGSRATPARHSIRTVDTRRAGNGNPDGERTYVRRTPPPLPPREPRTQAPRTQTPRALEVQPPRRPHATRPRHRRAAKAASPSIASRIGNWWLSLGKLRLVLGVVATIAIAMTIQRTIAPPEGLETNEVAVEAAPVIEPAAALEMFIPAIDVHAEFEEGSCRVKDGAINPETMTKACTYTAADRPYSLPGTNAPDISVIAGHTGAGVPGVFNNLYDGGANEHKVALGDKLYLRTANSGNNWLVYTATDMHDPVKEGLAEDSSIWGEGEMPGRLLTISCIQPLNLLEASVRNAVVGWQYEGVTTVTPPAE